jgi:hypothetical protein
MWETENCTSTTTLLYKQIIDSAGAPGVGAPGVGMRVVDTVGRHAAARRGGPASSPASSTPDGSPRCERIDARRNLAHGFLDGDESVVAVVIITTVELALLEVVSFITWHDTR